MDSRIHDALRNLERSDIGTIHSFAANLLRLYPHRSWRRSAISRRRRHGNSIGCSTSNGTPGWIRNWPYAAPTPRNGAKFSRAASSIKSKLSLNRWQRKPWTSATIQRIPTKSPRRCALGSANSPRKPRPWIARHPEDRMNEKLVRAARAVICEFEKSGRRLGELSRAQTRSWRRKRSAADLKGWSRGRYRCGSRARARRQGLGRCRRRIHRIALAFARSLRQDFRERFLRDGHISFDGLLVRARNLVRDQHARARRTQTALPRRS